MLTFRAISIVLAAVALAACGSSGGTAPPSNNNPGGGGGGGGSGVAPSVTVSNNTFSPDRVTVTRGGSVTWRWDSCSGDVYGGGETCVAHSVTFDDGSASAAPQSSGSFVRSFDTAGTFTYYCTAHGRASMSGSVVVQ